MDLRITDNAFFSNFFSACLKLRFDKTYDLSVFCEKISYRKKNFCQGDERNIDGRKCCRPFQIFRYHITDVCLFHAYDSRIIPEFPVQLSVSHINGINFDCSVLKHTVCETAGGCAYIHTYFIIQRYAEIFHGFLKFQSASADIGKRFSSYFQLSSLRKHGTCLVFFLAVNVYLSGHDISFCFFP